VTLGSGWRRLDRIGGAAHAFSISSISSPATPTQTPARRPS
jgi:hypothetical protein